MNFTVQELKELLENCDATAIVRFEGFRGVTKFTVYESYCATDDETKKTSPVITFEEIH